MDDERQKVIVALDKDGNPKYAKRVRDKEARAADEMTRRIKKAQKIINKENEQQ